MNARCGTHIGLTAVGTCERCGDYVCTTCLDTSYPSQCVRCASRLPHGIAWEDARAGAWPRRFTLTVSQMIVRPRIAFPGPVRSWSPLLFAYLCSLGTMGLYTLVAFAVRPGLASEFGLALRIASSVLTVSMLALGLTAWTLVLAASFAAGLYVVGRRVGVWRYALRAMAYGQGVMITYMMLDMALGLPLSLLDLPTAVGVTVTVITELLWVGGTFRVALAAGRGLGLSTQRAALAALAPTTWLGYIAVVRLVSGMQSFL